MMAQYGMFFIFLSVMHYAASIIATAFVSIKTGAFQPVYLQSLLFYHVLLVAGLIMSRDMISQMGYHPVNIFKNAMMYSLHSVPFLLVLSAVMFVVHLISGRVDLVEIIYCMILGAIFLHYRKRGY